MWVARSRMFWGVWVALAAPSVAAEMVSYGVATIEGDARTRVTSLNTKNNLHAITTTVLAADDEAGFSSIREEKTWKDEAKGVSRVGLGITRVENDSLYQSDIMMGLNDTGRALFSNKDYYMDSDLSFAYTEVFGYEGDANKVVDLAFTVGEDVVVENLKNGTIEGSFAKRMADTQDAEWESLSSGALSADFAPGAKIGLDDLTLLPGYEYRLVAEVALASKRNTQVFSDNTVLLGFAREQWETGGEVFASYTATESVTSGGASVPSPAAAVAGVLGLLVLGARRRRLSHHPPRSVARRAAQPR